MSGPDDGTGAADFHGPAGAQAGNIDDFDF